MKRTLLLLFVAMIISTNINSQNTKYSIATTPIEQETLTLDSIQVKTPQVRVFSETINNFGEFAPTTFINNLKDSVSIQNHSSISTFASTVTTQHPSNTLQVIYF